MPSDFTFFLGMVTFYANLSMFNASVGPFTCSKYSHNVWVHEILYLNKKTVYFCVVMSVMMRCSQKDNFIQHSFLLSKKKRKEIKYTVKCFFLVLSVVISKNYLHM